jgi:hypothetical protein
MCFPFSPWAQDLLDHTRSALLWLESSERPRPCFVRATLVPHLSSYKPVAPWCKGLFPVLTGAGCGEGRVPEECHRPGASTQAQCHLLLSLVTMGQPHAGPSLGPSSTPGTQQAQWAFT